VCTIFLRGRALAKILQTLVQAATACRVTTPGPATPRAAPPEDLAQLVGECLREPAPTLSKMPGGLSPRQFFRFARVSAEPAIAMWLPEDAPERELARRLGRRLPFLEIRELLEQVGVRVPRLFGARPERGLLVVEDLGETLAERCERRPAERAAWYRRAVQELATAQLALADLPSDCIVRTRAFDRELLTWELEHFREWGVEALGVTLTAGQRSAFEAATRLLAFEISALPRGFVHRDYQSRNLLATDEARVGWIDFQDALLGPRAYDLVALLRDSYQSFDETFVEERLGEFATARGLSATDASALCVELELITVQRKLKDAGRFVFFERTRGDPSYLRFFVPTLELVQAALSRLPARPELQGLAGIVTQQIEIGRSRGMLPT
jgi:aminoglycoside/choline kinase family phosphotransferase